MISFREPRGTTLSTTKASLEATGTDALFDVSAVAAAAVAAAVAAVRAGRAGGGQRYGLGWGVREALWGLVFCL